MGKIGTGVAVGEPERSITELNGRNLAEMGAIFLLNFLMFKCGNVGREWLIRMNSASTSLCPLILYCLIKVMGERVDDLQFHFGGGEEGEVRVEPIFF